MGRSGMIRLVGVEIGGTKQQVAVGTAQGEILDRRTVRLGDKTSARDILMWLEDNIREIMDRWEIGGIGVGFGGPLELGRGRVLCSLQVPGWMDFRLKEWFEERFGVPSVIVNDTVLGGIGELVLGSGAGSSRFFYTNIGTGIGGGLYLDGRYYDGSGFGAGYLGNTWVPDWRDSRPGAMTRLELICSGKSIEKRLNTPDMRLEDPAWNQGRGGFPARTWRKGQGQGICSAARNWTGLPGRFPWGWPMCWQLPPLTGLLWAEAWPRWGMSCFRASAGIRRNTPLWRMPDIMGLWKAGLWMTPFWPVDS